MGKDARTSAISSQFRQRATNIAVAQGLPAPDFGVAETETENETETETENEVEVEEEKPDPTVDSPKPEVIDWLLANGVESEREDLEAMTRKQMFERFVDTDG